jgi:hypothetical protein
MARIFVKATIKAIMRSATAWAVCIAMPVIAQTSSTPPIIFVQGTGAQSSDPALQAPTQPFARPVTLSNRPLITCASLPALTTALLTKYRAAPPRLALAELAEESLAVSPPWPAQRLDPVLLRTALASYARHICASANATGPAQIFVVDFAKRSDQPRLYRIDLRSGDGLDTPVLIAHGIGSDTDDDGLAQNFGNVQDSRMSSLGAARGAEIYDGINGRSLRLDGLDSSNYAMRARDIVVHSYAPNAFRYFSAAYRASRSGRPGMSEGCFVVEPQMREWLFAGLSSGGFLYAGLGGERPVETPKAAASQTAISFVPGTGN